MKKMTSIFILVVLMVCMAAVASAQTPDAWYKFDDASGTSAADSSAAANNATLSGSVTWSTAVDTSRNYNFGASCLSFTQDTVNRPLVAAADNAALNIGSGNVTVSFMLKINGVSQSDAHSVYLIKGLRAAGSGGGHYTVYMHTTNKTLIGELADTGNVKAFGTVSSPDNQGFNFYNNQWHHVAWVFDRTAHTVQCYTDGVDYGAANPTKYATTWNAIGANIDAPGSELHIGNTEDYLAGDRSWTGLMDEVRIYKSALTAMEVQAIAPAIPTPTPTPTNTPTPTPAGAVYWEIFD